MANDLITIPQNKSVQLYAYMYLSWLIISTASTCPVSPILGHFQRLSEQTQLLREHAVVPHFFCPATPPHRLTPLFHPEAAAIPVFWFSFYTLTSFRFCLSARQLKMQTFAELPPSCRAVLYMAVFAFLMITN